MFSSCFVLTFQEERYLLLNFSLAWKCTINSYGTFCGHINPISTSTDLSSDKIAGYGQGKTIRNCISTNTFAEICGMNSRHRVWWGHFFEETSLVNPITYAANDKRYANFALPYHTNTSKAFMFG